jgi:hypothetical protein
MTDAEKGRIVSGLQGVHKLLHLNSSLMEAQRYTSENLSMAMTHLDITPRGYTLQKDEEMRVSEFAVSEINWLLNNSILYTMDILTNNIKLVKLD